MLPEGAGLERKLRNCGQEWTGCSRKSKLEQDAPGRASLNSTLQEGAELERRLCM
jgi:hypothetical protein